MSAPLGNKNGRGAKGRSGRKSLQVEKANINTLANMYFEKQNQEKIETDIRAGKFSIQQRHILNAMEGEQKAIDVIVRKLFPDTMKVEEDIVIKVDLYEK